MPINNKKTLTLIKGFDPLIRWFVRRINVAEHCKSVMQTLIRIYTSPTCDVQSHVTCSRLVKIVHYVQAEEKDFFF